MGDEQSEQFGISMEFVGGANDGVVFDLCEDEDRAYFVSETFPGKKFKQVFVPLDMEHPDFIGH